MKGDGPRKRERTFSDEVLALSARTVSSSFDDDANLKLKWGFENPKNDGTGGALNLSTPTTPLTQVREVPSH